MKSGSSKPHRYCLYPTPRCLKWGCRVPVSFSSQLSCSNMDRLRNRSTLVFLQAIKLLRWIKLIAILQNDYPKESIKQHSAYNIIARKMLARCSNLEGNHSKRTQSYPQWWPWCRYSKDLWFQTTSIWAGMCFCACTWYPNCLPFSGFALCLPLTTEHCGITSHGHAPSPLSNPALLWDHTFPRLISYLGLQTIFNASGNTEVNNTD